MDNNCNTIKIYNGKCYGVEPSEYAKKYGYLDYKSLADIVGNRIINNEVIKFSPDHWEINNGDFESEDGSYNEVFQWFIIDDWGAEFLIDHTNEIVYYNEELDMYLWGVTHLGTSWDYVLTDLKMVAEDGTIYIFNGNN